jgi:glycosyltransferase involved in cell wall biosynthesis
MKGLIAIPVYNEHMNLPEIVKELKVAFPIKNLLFIDDGSTDNSVDILKNAGVPYICHPVNLGYDETIRTAMHYVLSHEYAFVVFCDSDGQHDIKDVKKIVKKFDNEECDMILGSRYKDIVRNQWSWRKIGTRFFSFSTTLLAGTKITDATSGLKLIHRSFIPLAVESFTEDLHAELIVAIAKNGGNIQEMKIDDRPRRGGDSMYHFWKALLYPAKTILCLTCVLVGKNKLQTKQ